MRTTLTLDEDVILNLKAQMKETGWSFKQTVNEAIRTGIVLLRKPKSKEPFVVKPFQTGLLPGLSLDNIEELLDQVEGPDRKW